MTEFSSLAPRRTGYTRIPDTSPMDRVTVAEGIKFNARSFKVVNGKRRSNGSATFTVVSVLAELLEGEDAPKFWDCSYDEEGIHFTPRVGPAEPEQGPELPRPSWL